MFSLAAAIVVETDKKGRCEERRFVSARAGSDFDDCRAVVERVMWNQGGLDLLFELGELITPTGVPGSLRTATLQPLAGFSVDARVLSRERPATGARSVTGLSFRPASSWHAPKAVKAAGSLS